MPKDGDGLGPLGLNRVQRLVATRKITSLQSDRAGRGRGEAEGEGEEAEHIREGWTMSVGDGLSENGEDGTSRPGGAGVSHLTKWHLVFENGRKKGETETLLDEQHTTESMEE